MSRPAIARHVVRRFVDRIGYVPFERGDTGLMDYQTALGDDQYRGPSKPVRFQQTPWRAEHYPHGYFTETQDAWNSPTGLPGGEIDSGAWTQHLRKALGWLRHNQYDVVSNGDGTYRVNGNPADGNDVIRIYRRRTRSVP